MLQWLVETLRAYPEIAIFLTLGLGFWVGKFKVGQEIQLVNHKWKIVGLALFLLTEMVLFLLASTAGTHF